jgi:hypothetical protein
MRRPIILLFCALVLAGGAAACGDDTETTPTEPTRPTTTETFGGTLTVNGAQTTPFAATGSGEIRVTVTTLSPDSAAIIGVSLGTFNQAGACEIRIANDNATQGTILIGNAGAVGTFCVRVNDVGRLSQPTEYTLTVVHY